jgi:TonB family protein
MITRNKISPALILRLLSVITVSLLFILAVASCSAGRKAAKTQKEVTAPPPPPSPPRQVIDPPQEVFQVVEQMPVYPGGDEALVKFISANVKYPEEAKSKNIMGRVIVRFCVTWDGKVDRVHVQRGVDPSLDTEAVRVIKLLSGWKPGMQGGKPVNVWYSIPVTFSLKADGIIPRASFFVYGNDTIWHSPEEPPQFPGGKEALARFKTDNLKVPSDLLDAGFYGNVIISFIVGKDGKLTNFSVSGGVSPSFDAEGMRVARMMPSWSPAKEKGRPVVSRQSVFFNFYPETAEGEVPKEVFVVVEEMPRFPGGDTALMNFVFRNITYPKEAKEKGIQGRVILRFAVNYLGGTEQIGVIKGVDPLLDAEAIRVIKMLPQWQPGKQGGKPVNVWYSVPVTFALEGVDLPKDKPAAEAAPPPVPPRPPVPAMVSGYDEPPVFPGGDQALLKFIDSNRKYPQTAKDKNISGTVKVRFQVTETGKVDKISVMSSVDPALDAEALRIVSLMPQWQPGKLQGKPVIVFYTIPVTFK